MEVLSLQRLEIRMFTQHGSAFSYSPAVTFIAHLQQWVIKLQNKECLNQQIKNVIITEDSYNLDISV